MKFSRAVLLGATSVILLSGLTLFWPFGDDQPAPPASATSSKMPIRKPSPLSSEAVPVHPPIATSATKANPYEAQLDDLYENPSVEARLAAARTLASEGTERAFEDLSTFIVAAEITGDPGLRSLAARVGEVLGTMRGDAIYGIATELAYSPSAVVAEAAVNALVPKESINYVSGSSSQTPEHQQELDAQAAQIFSEPQSKLIQNQ